MLWISSCLDSNVKIDSPWTEIWVLYHLLSVSINSPPVGFAAQSLHVQSLLGSLAHRAFTLGHFFISHTLYTLGQSFRDFLLLLQLLHLSG